MVAGLALAEDSKHIYGCVISVEGRGFRMRPRVVAATEYETPAHVAQLVDCIVGEQPFDGGAVAALGNEFADLHARVLQNLKMQLPDDEPVVLATALADHVWHYLDPAAPEPLPLLPLFDPVRLAELSGVTVIDDFTRRDVAAGGDGHGVLLCPYWLLFSDRSTNRDKRHARVVVTPAGATSPRAVVYYFPPHAVQGDALPPMAFLNVAGGGSSSSLAKAIAGAIVSRTQAEQPHWPRVQKLILGAVKGVDDLQLEIEQQMPDVETGALTLGTHNATFPPRYLHAAAAAVLATLHIDQAPANLPENAGDATPRVLGRLTPGSPVHWRRILRMMAQHDLPATTLNRAI